MGRVLSDDERDRVNKQFEKFKRTKFKGSDFQKIFDNETAIYNLFNNKALKLYAEYVRYFIMMVKDYFTKKYREIPYGTIAAIVGTLLYVLSPIDIIPDVIPAVGLIDDAAIVALCVGGVALDVERYREWKNNQAEIDDMYSE